MRVICVSSERAEFIPEHSEQFPIVSKMKLATVATAQIDIVSICISLWRN